MKVSAGLLMYQTIPELQVFLVHPGGPYFRNKHKGWWTIPKGLPEDGEGLLTTAKREFKEETGLDAQAPYIGLEAVKQKGGKVVYAWAFAGSWLPADGINCNTFTIEWPPRSGIKAGFPEVDKARWFGIEEALEYINEAQQNFLKELQAKLNAANLL